MLTLHDGVWLLKVVKEACDAASPDKQPMHTVPVDVTGSEDSLKAFAETTVSTVPRVDYCFLAAGASMSIAAEQGAVLSYVPLSQELVS